MIALFMAGGSGTRLWPLSRRKNPKQLHRIIGQDSLITQTVNRMSPLIEPSEIWIVTNRHCAAKIAQASPKVPRDQIIVEPFPLGTNLAVGLGLIKIAKTAPDQTVAIGWADSYIGRETEFRRALTVASEACATADGVLLAVKPTYPATGYGYIKTGRELPQTEGVFNIARFEEKPNLERAAQFFSDSSYYWNPGISVFKVSTLLELMRRLTPDHFQALEYVSAAKTPRDEALRMKKGFAGLQPMPIDQAIFERAENLVTIPAELDWNDIGSWSAVYDVQAPIEQTCNVTRGSVVAVETEKCLIYSDKRLIATLGVKDLVIVETPDAILVAHRSETERLKELHARVQHYGGAKYL